MSQWPKLKGEFFIADKITLSLRTRLTSMIPSTSQASRGTISCLCTKILSTPKMLPYRHSMWLCCFTIFPKAAILTLPHGLNLKNTSISTEENTVWDLSLAVFTAAYATEDRTISSSLPSNWKDKNSPLPIWKQYRSCKHLPYPNISILNSLNFNFGILTSNRTMSTRSPLRSGSINTKMLSESSTLSITLNISTIKKFGITS